MSKTSQQYHKRIIDNKCPRCCKDWHGPQVYCLPCREFRRLRRSELRAARSSELRQIDSLLYNIPGTNRLDRIAYLVNSHLKARYKFGELRSQ